MADVESQVALTSERPPEVSVASTLIPYKRDDERALYLGYLATGFGVREALKMVKRGKSALSMWRRDATFVKLEDSIPDIRRTLAREYVELEFFRNFRLVLAKDYEILQKSLTPGDTGVMTKQESDYLIKLRSQYSPQQMEILLHVVGEGGEGMDFSKWVFEHPEVFTQPDTVKLTRTESITLGKQNA